MTTYSDRLRLAKQELGENKTIWGDVLNDMIQMVDDAIAGVADVDMTPNSVALTDLDGQTCESRMMCLNLSGTPTEDAELIVPRRQKVYCVVNGTARTVTVKTSSGTGAAIEAAEERIVVVDELLNQVFSLVASGIVTSPESHDNPFSYVAYGQQSTSTYSGSWSQEGNLLSIGLLAHVSFTIDEQTFIITAPGGGSLEGVPGIAEAQQISTFVNEAGVDVPAKVALTGGKIVITRYDGAAWVPGAQRYLEAPVYVFNTVSDYD